MLCHWPARRNGRNSQKTVAFALSLNCDTLQFSGAVPFLGTEFFTLAEDKGWLKSHNWQDWLGGGEQKGVVEYPHISQDKINYYVDSGLKNSTLGRAI